ncbi:MAG: sulfite exporter TauE/SafE family protein [Actinobacteria bacterium HGW-Actinobacteria-8]|nr:MAG: sulfite exporter TauE/SafE family protein [Actinobacteria bacterium HGW-Actinobacteria-8]
MGAEIWVMTIGLLVLSVASGMLGLGVAFAAVPFLGFFMGDLVHEVQPLSLFLNGVTAIFAAVGFAKSGLVAWRPALMLTAVAAAGAPLGSWLAQGTNPAWLWGLYLVAVGYLAFRMFQKSGGPSEGDLAHPRLGLALILAVPISVVAGLLGVGPGFLLMPVLIVVGYQPKVAAGITAVAVTLPSFTALIPHVGTAEVDLGVAAILVVVGAAGSFLGARLTSRFVSGPTLKRAFGILIVVMTAVKVVTIVTG